MGVSTTQSLSPFGFSPSGVNVNPFVTSSPGSFFSPYGAQSGSQILQLLQVVPQHVHQLLQLTYFQQQQLHQLQQIVQLIPAHLIQLQQQIQSQQPFGQMGGGTGAGGLSPWGISPQIFGAQPGYVM